ncbi:MAG: UDP-N-acetylglucosamine--N-acetylmuramyl-(pentapeptide) pyrophosphoryl-undecaprenol N-acetylglucosamine transferase [Candidatus Zipacnadales bacterium]
MAARVMFVGGGTAGHTIPCIAVSEALVTRRTDVEYLFIGSDRPVDRGLFERLQLCHELLSVRPFPYRPSLGMWRAYRALKAAQRRASEIIARYAPQVLFSTGGYVSAPIVPQAAHAGVPVILHAADAMPGRANRSLARYARIVTLTYERAAAYFPPAKVRLVGQPLRSTILQASRKRGREALGVAAHEWVLLVIGGSQGADSINRAVIGALPHLLSIQGLHIVHFTGAAHLEAVRKAAARVPTAERARYEPYGFLDDPGDTLAAADLVVTRCGASSLAEIAYLGVPSIVVPYPYAGDHQRLNAKPLVEAGAAVLIEDRYLSGGTLGGIVSELLGDSDRLKRMAQAARSLAKPEAATQIAELLIEHLSET